MPTPRAWCRPQASTPRAGATCRQGGTSGTALYIPLDRRANPYAMYGYQMNQNGRLKRYSNNEDDYLTDVLGSLATDFVKRAACDDAPFFLYLVPTAPHLPAIPVPRHRGSFDGLDAPRPPSFNEADMSDKPAWLAGKRALSAAAVRRLDRTYQRQAESRTSPPLPRPLAARPQEAEVGWRSPASRQKHEGSQQETLSPASRWPWCSSRSRWRMPS